MSETKKPLEALARRSKRSKFSVAGHVAAVEWQISEIQAGVVELEPGKRGMERQVLTGVEPAVSGRCW